MCYESHAGAFTHYLAEIKTFLLNLYSIKIIPALKEDDAIPKDYKAFLLESAQRVTLLEAIDNAKDLAGDLEHCNVDPEVCSIHAKTLKYR